MLSLNTPATREDVFPNTNWAVQAVFHLKQEPVDLDQDQDLVDSHLQLQADVLSVLAELIQGADGRLHMTAVFPVDQQPGTRTKAPISTS